MSKTLDEKAAALAHKIDTELTSGEIVNPPVYRRRIEAAIMLLSAELEALGWPAPRYPQTERKPSGYCWACNTPLSRNNDAPIYPMSDPCTGERLFFHSQACAATYLRRKAKEITG